MKDTRTEGQIQRATVRVLRQIGFTVWSTSQARASSVTAGVADLYVTGRGVCCWIEMKAAWGKQTAEQARFQKAVEDNGGRYLLAHNELEVLAYLLPAEAA